MSSSPRIAKGLREALRHSFEEATKQRHEYVTLEHLLVGLLDDEKVDDAIRACGGTPKRLRRELHAFLETSIPKLP
ncbi:MAG: hypothetical protein MJD61_10845, partial [Proteobacteria bacterium]|nr:hypothetical protein [Pseudomonadota bacterium]